MVSLHTKESVYDENTTVSVSERESQRQLALRDDEIDDDTAPLSSRLHEMLRRTEMKAANTQQKDGSGHTYFGPRFRGEDLIQDESRTEYICIPVGLPCVRLKILKEVNLHFI